MDITIPPHNLKRFTASLTCLAKIGKDLTVYINHGRQVLTTQAHHLVMVCLIGNDINFFLEADLPLKTKGLFETKNLLLTSLFRSGKKFLGKKCLSWLTMIL